MTKPTSNPQKQVDRIRELLLEIEVSGGEPNEVLRCAALIKGQLVKMTKIPSNHSIQNSP